MQTLKRVEDIHFAEVEDDFYCTLENRNVVACMNRPAFAVVENLDGFAVAKDISTALARACGSEERRVHRAVERVCSQLQEVGILVENEVEGEPSYGPFAFLDNYSTLPEVTRIWQGDELAGGLFVNSSDCDIHVIVPNVTDGPIKTCPPHTCTIPAGLFTARTIIRTFDEEWRKNFESIRRSGIVHFRRG